MTASMRLFAIEREINGFTAQERLAVRHEHSRPLVVALETWLREQRGKLSSKSDTARAVDYSLRHWSGLTRFVADSAGLACGPARALPSAPRRDQSRSRVGYARKILGWDRDGASRSSRRGPTRMRTTAVMRTAVINCNHLVGDSEQRLRHVDAQQPCGL